MVHISGQENSINRHNIAPISNPPLTPKIMASSGMFFASLDIPAYQVDVGAVFLSAKI